MSDSSIDAGSVDGAAGSQPAKVENVVAKESFDKLLDQKKKRDEQLREAQLKLEKYESERKAREEADLEKKGEVQKLLELKSKELEDVQSKLQSKIQADTDAFKMQSAVDAIKEKTGLGLDRKYFGLIPYHDVLLDESGSVDGLSLSKVVESFTSSYPEVLVAPTGKKMPNSAPSQGAASMTMEEYNALPLKERLAKKREFMQAELKRRQGQ